jgi:hypothetical protein
MMETDSMRSVYKKILILQGSLLVAVVFFVIAGAIAVYSYHRLLQQSREEQRERIEEIVADLILVKGGIADIQETVDLRTAEIQRMLAVQLGAIGRLGEQGRDIEIVGMMSEKLGYDYVQTAMRYFEEGNYGNAYTTFSLALRYQRGNSVLRFYQIYSLYLRHSYTRLTDSEVVIIQEGINELNRRGFREQDQLEFSLEEMREKLTEMESNVELLQTSDFQQQADL